MTNTEFEDEIDVIYENINKGGAVGLDIYEKSVILTMAQEELAIELLNTDLALVPQLVHTENPVISKASITKIHSDSVLFKLPDNYIKIEQEVAGDGTTDFIVVPISMLDYKVVMQKPYRFPKRRTTWRLVNSIASGISGEGAYIELIGPNNKTITSYRVTVSVFPDPIILGDLTEYETGELTIRGKSAETETNLSETYHPTILKYATTLAEKFYLDKYNPQQN